MEKKGEIKEGVYPLFTPLSRSESIRCKTSHGKTQQISIKWKMETRKKYNTGIILSS